MTVLPRHAIRKSGGYVYEKCQYKVLSISIIATGNSKLKTDCFENSGIEFLERVLEFYEPPLSSNSINVSRLEILGKLPESVVGVYSTNKTGPLSDGSIELQDKIPCFRFTITTCHEKNRTYLGFLQTDHIAKINCELYLIITWYVVHCFSSVHCTQCIVQI